MTPEIQQLEQALKHQPHDPALYYELGRCYLALQESALAWQAFAQALVLAPDHPQILMQLGNVANLQGDDAMAVQHFKASLKQDPRQADVHFNLANSLRKLGQRAMAVQHYQQSLTLQPKDADTWNNLGNVWREQGELAQAIQAYEQALRIHPQMMHAKVHWIHQKQHMANWTGLEAAIQDVRQAIQSQQVVKIPPFAFLAMPGTTASEQQSCASLWAQQHYGHIRALPALEPKIPGTPIKLAYVSADFRRHPLAFLVTDVLKAHHRDQFEVYLYSQSEEEDTPEYLAFQQAADHWQTINKMSDAAVVEHMRTAHIDIVIDLTGYTQNSRSGIIAYRPARKHINWLGFPGTMGLLHGKPLFDHIFVDPILASVPLTEQAVLLPCYQPNNAQRPIDASANPRSSHGLPSDGFVFCSFNQSFKITAAIFATWMRILHAVPDSVLWLLECNRWATANMRQAASTAGIHPERLIFAPRTEIGQHIDRQKYADLMLDTTPYNAHTTASDALWRGVPIVTIEGESFPSRVTSSLLHRIGMQALICQDMAEYEGLAIRLATDTDFYQCIRERLNQNKQPLFSPETYVKTLEDAYKTLLTQ